MLLTHQERAGPSILNPQTKTKTEAHNKSSKNPTTPFPFFYLYTFSLMSTQSISAIPSMARDIILDRQPLTTSHIGFTFGTLLLCAFALFMCASHSRRWRKWRACYGYGDHDPVIQLNHEMIHFGDVDSSTISGEASVWKKNILMGGKCELPDFSGVIIYDSAGNVVTPAKTPRALPWK